MMLISDTINGNERTIIVSQDSANIAWAALISVRANYKDFPYNIEHPASDGSFVLRLKTPGAEHPNTIYECKDDVIRGIGNVDYASALLDLGFSPNKILNSAFPFIDDSTESNTLLRNLFEHGAILECDEMICDASYDLNKYIERVINALKDSKINLEQIKILDFALENDCSPNCVDLILNSINNDDLDLPVAAFLGYLMQHSFKESLKMAQALNTRMPKWFKADTVQDIKQYLDKQEDDLNANMFKEYIQNVYKLVLKSFCNELDEFETQLLLEDGLNLERLKQHAYFSIENNRDVLYLLISSQQYSLIRDIAVDNEEFFTAEQIGFFAQMIGSSGHECLVTPHQDTNQFEQLVQYIGDIKDILDLANDDGAN